MKGAGNASEGTFAQRPEGGEGRSHVVTSKKNLPGRGNNKP